MATSIGISGLFRQDQLAGGVFSYFENLMRGFDALLEDESNSKIDVTIFHGRAKMPWQGTRLHWREISDRFGRFAAETKLGMLHSQDFDAVLFPNYFTPPFVRARRAVTVIHDLQYLHMANLCPTRKRLWLKACHAVTLRRCAKVVTISQAVKQDILQQYGERWADQIRVIWNPISTDRLGNVAEDADTPSFTDGRPYILCVAVDRPQKNLYSLIKAFDHLVKWFPDHCLVLAGQLRSSRRSPREQSQSVGRKMPSTVDLVSDMGLESSVRVTGFISDQQLGTLYRGAQVVILPSLFEGFGMPAVEAIAMGAPTLVSDLPVLREVTLGMAQYLAEPQDIAAMADRLREMLSHRDAYRPSESQIQRIRESFSPRNIAQQYLEVLSE